MRILVPGPLAARDSMPKPELEPNEPERLLPSGLSDDLPPLRFGSYLKALLEFFRRDGWTPLLDLLEIRLRHTVRAENLRDLSISSEKHGAWYHVARLQVEAGGETYRFAVNTAALPRQRELLEREYGLLRELHSAVGSECLPEPYMKGDTEYVGENGEKHALKLFVAEWLEDFHEFHLSGGENASAVRLWNGSAEGILLTAEEMHSLFRGTAGLLTACLDPAELREVYPWHHAAGDFVAQRNGTGGVGVRLITVRGYRRISPFPREDPESFWAGLLLFFLNLTVHNRVDRLDGTGALALAGPEAIRSTVEGFFHSWESKTRADDTLPDTAALRDLLQSLTPGDWLGLAEHLPETYFADEEEFEFLVPRLPEHTEFLARFLPEAL
jgi:hypothetical protein